MPVRHTIVPHLPGARCGVSLFVEGRHQKVITVVITELPDNAGTPARDAFVSAVARIRRALLKHIGSDRIVWVYRRAASSAALETMEIAHLTDDGADVARWEPLNPVCLGQVVNREGGFARRDVFIPRFRPLKELGERPRTMENVVTYVSS